MKKSNGKSLNKGLLVSAYIVVGVIVFYLAIAVLMRDTTEEVKSYTDVAQAFYPETTPLLTTPKIVDESVSNLIYQLETEPLTSKTEKFTLASTTAVTSVATFTSEETITAVTTIADVTISPPANIILLKNEALPETTAAMLYKSPPVTITTIGKTTQKTEVQTLPPLADGDIDYAASYDAIQDTVIEKQTLPPLAGTEYEPDPPETTSTTTTSSVNYNPPASQNSTGNWDTLSYTYNGSKTSAPAFDVVCKIVNAEMGPSFQVEALKAQAIAAYSYVKNNNNRGVSPSIVMKGDVPEKVSNAVREVCGLAVYYNGEIAQTVYSASTGGSTASAVSVWGNDVPYLISVESLYDSLDPHFGDSLSISENDVKLMIENATGMNLSKNPQNWINVLSRIDGGYVGDVSIDGQTFFRKNGKDVDFTGRYLREVIFKFKLKSARFDVTYSNGMFNFITYGYGHGVGMPQHGANFYASKSGYSYQQIISQYFPETVIY